MAATARSATSSNRATAARSWTCCCRSSPRAPTSHREPRRGEMFNAAFVSSPDGGRTCFGSEENGPKKKRIAQQAIRFSDSGALQDSGDRRNVLPQYFFGKQPVAPAPIILQLAG